MDTVILASQSPRRKELLNQMGVAFEVVPSTYDEQLDDSRTPQEVAQELALGKALEVAERYPDKVVIGSDTIVEVEGRQLEKPLDAEDARKILTLLSGKPNNVITAIAVVCMGTDVRLIASDTTEVHFKPYDEAAIEAYIATGDPFDKAGAYGIQSGAAPLIDYIKGEYDTVVGLPTHILSELLKEVGISSMPVTITCPVPQRKHEE